MCAEVRLGPSQRGAPGSCESVGGGHLQQLRLQRPQDPIRCIYFSSMCYIQNAGTEIKEIFSLSLDPLGAADSQTVESGALLWWGLG